MSSDDDPFHSDAGDVPGNPLILNALEIARMDMRVCHHGKRLVDVIENHHAIV